MNVLTIGVAAGAVVLLVGGSGGAAEDSGNSAGSACVQARKLVSMCLHMNVPL